MEKGRKKELLSLLRNCHTDKYRIVTTRGEKWWCFGTYSRSGVRSGEKFKHPDLHIDMQQTRELSYTEGYLKDPLLSGLYTNYVNRLMGTLNQFMKTEYNTDKEILSIYPKEPMYRIAMLAFLIKVRTLYETPYILTAILAEYFEEDFPELNLEEISYILDVFIAQSSPSHGLYIPYGGQGVSQYMSFEDIMKKAIINNNSGINVSPGSILSKISSEKIPLVFTQYPEDAVQRYQQILEKKSSLINTCIKTIKYEKSVPCFT